MMLALVDNERPGPVPGGFPANTPDSLAIRAQGGDRAALRELLAVMAPHVLGVARAILGAGAPDVDDVAQESLIAFFHALPAFRAESSVRHYAGRITARTALAARRRARKDEHRLDEIQRVSAPLGILSSHDAEALAARRRELLRTLLGELPEAQAEALALRIVMGYSMQEVAEATGAPLNTVRSRLRLAKEALRVRIESDADALEMLEEDGA
jgi:RNA polymerase sigma-70 factor, ECF subfamily